MGNDLDDLEGVYFLGRSLGDQEEAGLGLDVVNEGVNSGFVAYFLGP